MSKLTRAREDVAISLAHQQGRVTRKMLMDKLNISRGRAYEVLDRLVERGFFIRHSRGQNTFYSLRKLD